MTEGENRSKPFGSFRALVVNAFVVEVIAEVVVEAVVALIRDAEVGWDRRVG